jgi:predicted dehydrogenase
MKIRAALIGYGYWGKILEKYLHNSDKFYLATVFSRRLENKDIYTNNIDIIINDISIEAVFICSPVSTHFYYCEKFLLLNKNVFCEKPKTETLSEFDVLNNLTREQNKVLFTDYIYTVSPSIHKLKEILPLIGPLSSISCKICQNGKIYKNESVYATLGVHMLSVIIYLLDKKPDNITFSDFVDKVYGFIEMIYPENIKVKIECNLIYPTKERIIILYGERGVLYFNMLEEKTIQRFIKMESGIKPLEFYCFDEKNNLKFAIDTFYKCIEDGCSGRNNDISRNVIEILNSR